MSEAFLAARMGSVQIAPRIRICGGGVCQRSCRADHSVMPPYSESRPASPG